MPMENVIIGHRQRRTVYRTLDDTSVSNRFDISESWEV